MMLLKISNENEKTQHQSRARCWTSPAPKRSFWCGVFWTKHSRSKMRQYRLSEKKVLGVLRKPERKEEGIASGTIANMQTAGTKKHPTEVWMMYQIINSKLKGQSSKIRKIKIISAWRYPGRTPKGQRPIIPEDTINELDNIIKK